jgi:phage FluMu protein Com
VHQRGMDLTVAASWREPEAPKQMIDIRCKSCRRLLMRVEPKCGRIEVVCPDNRCKRYQQHLLKSQ